MSIIKYYHFENSLFLEKLDLIIEFKVSICYIINCFYNICIYKKIKIKIIIFIRDD
jgi:hypothetical protein